MEKTYNSTGGLGFKFHFNASGFKKYFANYHVLDRWPPFVRVVNGTDRKIFKLIDYAEGWLSTTNVTTSAANSVLLRLSNLRGH
jgi:hypothetical protein